MYYTLDDKPEVNLELFSTAEENIRKRLCKSLGGGDSDWIRRTDLATHEDDDVRISYKAWMQCRAAIDKTREDIARDAASKEASSSS